MRYIFIGMLYDINQNAESSNRYDTCVDRYYVCIDQCDVCIVLTSKLINI